MRRPVVLIASVLLLAACGGGQPTTAPGATNAPAATPTGQPTPEADATPGTDLSACEIVTASEIEAALGLDPGTVDAGELREAGTVLDPAATECRYNGEDWGGLVVSLTPTDGVNTYDALVSTFGDEAEEVDIADGGLWFEDDDRGYFLKGAVLVRLQFTFLVDTKPFRDPTVALGTVALGKV
jgi:hypothetical protein